MIILIANLGSTSFKFRLFRMDERGGEVIAGGGYERVTDHGEAIHRALDELVEQGKISGPEDIEAVGFKTVLGRGVTGCVEADEAVIAALEGFAKVAPAHNPPYVAGIRKFAEFVPDARRIALFETAYYQWLTPAAAVYAVPKSWRDLGIRRYGFHGASHKFIAERSAELCGRDEVVETVRHLYSAGPPLENQAAPFRVISCHLGGSSSVTAILDGIAIGTSMGFSPQSGLPQNNRVGDLDAEAIPFACSELGIDLTEAKRQLSAESGLLGLSGISNDLRDIQAAADAENPDARLAIDHLVHSIRHWIGAFLLELGGVDALVFTAGIGENNPRLRTAVCAGLKPFGLCLDAEKNTEARAIEMDISSDDSPSRIFIIPANEEMILAREVFRAIEATEPIF